MLEGGFLGWFTAGGVVMYPLAVFSFLMWWVIFERWMRFRKMEEKLRAFQLEAMNAILRNDEKALQSLCRSHPDLPTADLIQVALERIRSTDKVLREKWKESVERRRQLINQDLKKNLWVLGSIASASPFIGLFGTVVGILSSFSDMAESGKGGFSVVAGGISEALVATAAGILVAVVAVLAYNVFQTRWNGMVIAIRIHMEELLEVLSSRQGLGSG